MTPAVCGAQALAQQEAPGRQEPSDYTGARGPRHGQMQAETL